MPDALSTTALDFLVRALPARDLWNWLSQEARFSLRQRVAQGFRATSAALRQPSARTRLVSHLQHSPDDCRSLLELWGQSEPEVLAAIRDADNESLDDESLDDESLLARLPDLQRAYGKESLLLALWLDEREAVLEALTEQSDIAFIEPAASGASTPDAKTPQNDALQNDALQKRWERAQSRIEQLQAKAREAKTSASQTEKVLREKLREQETLAREAQLAARHAQSQHQQLEAKYAEAEKTRERAERKTRSTQTELEDALAQAKNLRRQLHRLQHINEELRGQIATLHENQKENRQVAAVEITAQKSESTPPFAAPAFDAAKSNQLNAGQIKAAIDRNDETFVATLRDSLRDLRERAPKTHKTLIAEVRKQGRYYERVLTAPMMRVLVDASNVARHDGPGKGKLEYLRAMREELRRCDFFPITFIADASLPYHIDDGVEFRRLMKTGEIIVSASGQEADEILAKEARETGAYVVTNDRHFHTPFAPDFSPSRIGFQILDGVVMLGEF